MHGAFLKGGDHDEIILSAGALGSPQLLMLSGIGPKEQLGALKIDCMLEQPFVGKDMADNPLNTLFIPFPVIVERSLIHVVGITPFSSYIQSTGGSNFIMANKSSYLGFIPEVSTFTCIKSLILHTLIINICHKVTHFLDDLYMLFYSTADGRIYVGEN